MPWRAFHNFASHTSISSWALVCDPHGEARLAFAPWMFLYGKGKPQLIDTGADKRGGMTGYQLPT
jgi:hypothetical protein